MYRSAHCVAAPKSSLAPIMSSSIFTIGSQPRRAMSWTMCNIVDLAGISGREREIQVYEALLAFDESHHDIELPIFENKRINRNVNRTRYVPTSKIFNDNLTDILRHTQDFGFHMCTGHRTSFKPPRINLLVNSRTVCSSPSPISSGSFFHLSLNSTAMMAPSKKTSRAGA